MGPSVGGPAKACASSIHSFAVSPFTLSSVSRRCRRWVTTRQKSLASPSTESGASEGPQVQNALFCKRPCFDDEYLPTFNRENVDLIDTGGLGVEKITSGGVVVAGEEYEVDCIIFATGFEVGTGYERRAGCQVVGADGRTLTEKWDEHGVSTLHGLQTSGYPNYFMLGANQGAFTVNFPHLLDEAATNTVCIIKHTVDEGYLTVDVVQEAEDEWVKTIVEKARGPIGSGPGSTECTPGYYNNEGHLNEKARQGAPYGGGSVEFFKLMEGWRNDGDFKGLKFN